MLKQVQEAHLVAHQRALVAEGAVKDFRNRNITAQRFLQQRTNALRESNERVEQLRTQLKAAAAAPPATAAGEELAALQARCTRLTQDLEAARDRVGRRDRTIAEQQDTISRLRGQLQALIDFGRPKRP